MTTIRSVLQCADLTDFAIALDKLVVAREAKVGFTALAAVEQVAFCIGALEREVNNGGFEQFFLNSSGEHALDTARALDAIGATQTAALVRAALELVGGDLPADASERAEILEDLSDDTRARLENLDAQFYLYEENPSELLRVYVINHVDQFPS